MKSLLRALRYLWPYWPWQLAAFACALVSVATGFIWPFATKWLVDGVLMPGPAGLRLATLGWVTAATIAAVVVGSVFGIARAYLFARVSESAAADLRRELFAHLHDLPMSFFDRRRTGAIMSVLQSDVEALQSLYASTLVDIVTNVLTAVVAVAILWHHSPALTLEGLPVPILFGVVLAIFGRPLHRVGRRVRDAVQEVQEVLQESAAGAREVKAFGRAGLELSRYWPRVQALVKARISQSVLGSANWSAASLVAWGGMTGVMVLAAREVIGGRMTAGTAVLFVNALAMLFGPASAVSMIYNQVMGALGAADRVSEFQDEPPEAEREGALDYAITRGEVRFERVSFAYEGGEEVLREIDLEVAPGEMVAVVGPSGAGKTTLVSLLPRLYEVTSGRVLIDGVDVRKIRLDALRRQIALVPQEPFLFATTIRENIAFGREGASEEEIVEAAKAANAHDFILALPDGYETQVGERGARLSVGQKQRIAIARAILRDPRILILDEATSAQDSESERLVQEAMRRLMEGRTAFVIAHRLATVLRADRIVVLEGGRITEMGSHAELVARGGAYARLYALQFAAVEEQDAA